MLGPLAAFKDIAILNDEAHHAYRMPADVKVSKKQAEEQGLDLEEATRWIEGLDRVHETLRIAHCFDLSATPFAPTGRTNTEQGLFEWIVSDFGLNDAIEAGLVKTPRVVVRDGVIPDTKTLRPKLYHLYRDPAVSDALKIARAVPELQRPFMTLVGKADALIKAGRVSEAEELITAALGEAAKEGALGYQAELPVRLALVAVARKQTPQALAEMAKAAEFARAAGANRIFAGLALERARILRRGNRTAEAESVLREGITSSRSMGAAPESLSDRAPSATRTTGQRSHCGSSIARNGLCCK